MQMNIFSLMLTRQMKMKKKDIIMNLLLRDKDKLLILNCNNIVIIVSFLSPNNPFFIISLKQKIAFLL